MKHTLYELTSLRDTRTGVVYPMLCNIPMNTPLMLIRTKGNQLGIKRLKTPHRARIRAHVQDNQLQLL